MVTRLTSAATRLREDPDLYLALLALVLGLVAAVLSARAYGSLVPFGLLSAALAGVYLLYRRRAAREYPATHLSTTPLLVLSLLFVLSLAVALSTLATPGYVLPLRYYFAVAVGYALLGITALWMGEGQRWTAYLVLAGAIALGLLLRLSQTALYPGMLGIDPWVTSSVSQVTQQSGFLPHEMAPGIGFDYRSFPFYYLQVAVNGLITGLAPSSSLAVAIGLPEMLSILLLFLVGRSLAGTKVGLMAALFISLNDRHIQWGGNELIPMSLALVYFSLVLYLVLKAWQTNSLRFKALLLCALFALVLTHTITSLVLGIVLVVSYIAFRAHEAAFGPERVAGSHSGTRLPVGTNLILLFGVATLGYWMYASRFFWEIGKAIKYALLVASQAVTPPVATIHYDSLAQMVVGETRYLVTIELVILGGLLWLFRKNRRPERTIILVSAFALFMILRVSDETDIDILLPDRWEVFYYLLWALLASFVLVELARVFRASIPLAGVAVFALALAMSVSPVVVSLSPVYPAQYRVALFTRELAIIRSLHEPLLGASVVTDSAYIPAWRYGYDYQNITELDERFFLEGEYPPGALYVLRQHVLDYPLVVTDREKLGGYGGKTLDVGRQVLQQVETAPYDRIYSNGTVWGYYR